MRAMHEKKPPVGKKWIILLAVAGTVILALAVAFFLLWFFRGDKEADTSSPVKTTADPRKVSTCFSWEIPKYWKGRYRIEERHGTSTFISKRNEDTDSGGHLFALKLFDDDEYINLPSYVEMGEATIDGDKYTLVTIFPTDVQFSSRVGEEEYMKEYLSMQGDIKSILSSLKAKPGVDYTPNDRWEKEYADLKVVLPEGEQVKEEETAKVEGGQREVRDPGGSVVIDSDQFVFPRSSVDYLTDADLRFLEAWDLKVARNEIYARHGRIFEDPDLRTYFNMCDWYRGTIRKEDFKDSWLNNVEKANIELIQKHEKAVQSVT